MALTPDAAGAVIGEITRRIEALRNGRYEGRDKVGLAVVTVDGNGVVCDVALSKTIARYRREAVADAIRDAITAAQATMTQAYEELAAEAEKLAGEGGDE